MNEWYVMKVTFDIDANRNWTVLIEGPMDYPIAFNTAKTYNRTRGIGCVYSAVKMEKEI